MADMDEKRINEAADSLNSAGYDVLPITLDVSDEQQVKMAVEQVVSHFGKIDVAYNNVGIHAAVRENLADTEGWDFDHVLAVNLRGIWNCMKYELVEMKSMARELSSIVRLKADLSASLV